MTPDAMLWPLLAGVCGGLNVVLVLVLLAVAPHLLRQWQAGQVAQPRVRKTVPVVCRKEDFGVVVSTWTAGPWEYVCYEEKAPGAVQIWFQEK